MATHTSIFAWRFHMDRGAWWATVQGITKSQTASQRLVALLKIACPFFSGSFWNFLFEKFFCNNFQKFFCGVCMLSLSCRGLSCFNGIFDVSV